MASVLLVMLCRCAGEKDIMRLLYLIRSEKHFSFGVQKTFTFIVLYFYWPYKQKITACYKLFIIS